METQGAVRIGISGWRYKPWRGVFYPHGLQQRRELEFASRQFRSIEINGTHYSLQRAESFRQWREQTPEGFVFSVKGSRFITHMRKLREVELPLANFFAQGLLALGPKLGPVLWQFAPRFVYEPERLAAFFRMLPRTHAEAAALAHEHGPSLKGRSVVEAECTGAILHCIEIRHASFAKPEFVALLREHRIGLVVADTVEWPLLFDLTAEFVYCRLHGSEELYASGYEAEAIERWAARIAGWARGKEAGDEAEQCRPRGVHCSPKRAARRGSRDVYVYFDNDVKVRAPFDALALRARVDALLGAGAAG